MSKVRIVVEHKEKRVPDAPVVTTIEIYDVESAELYEALARGGYAEDGRFEVSQIIGGQQLPPDGM